MRQFNDSAYFERHSIQWQEIELSNCSRYHETPLAQQDPHERTHVLGSILDLLCYSYKIPVLLRYSKSPIRPRVTAWGGRLEAQD